MITWKTQTSDNNGNKTMIVHLKSYYYAYIYMMLIYYFPSPQWVILPFPEMVFDIVRITKSRI